MAASPAKPHDPYPDVVNQLEWENDGAAANPSNEGTGRIERPNAVELYRAAATAAIYLRSTVF